MLHVVCAVVEHQGEILCMQKGDHKYSYISHHWEFPGGKVEQGETEEQALVRELMEEMDYHVTVERHLLTTEYIYPDFEISLSAYLCHPANNESPRLFKMKEHIQSQWLAPSHLNTLVWAPADKQLIDEISKTRFTMKKQILFVGTKYELGVMGKKLLVVGHQKHASDDERKRYTENPIQEYNIDTDNIDMMNEYISGECMKWKASDRKSMLQFCKMLSGNLDFKLGTGQSADLLNSFAFCNYLQVPDFNLVGRQGKDEEKLYEDSKSIFNEYLEEIKPEKIIVWGNHAYHHIVKLGKRIDDRKCRITMQTGHIIDVLRINHPCVIGRGGYEQSVKQIKEFMTA